VAEKPEYQAYAALERGLAKLDVLSLHFPEYPKQPDRACQLSFLPILQSLQYHAQ